MVEPLTRPRRCGRNVVSASAPSLRLVALWQATTRRIRSGRARPIQTARDRRVPAHAEKYLLRPRMSDHRVGRARDTAQGNRRSVQVDRPITRRRRPAHARRRAKHRTPRQKLTVAGEGRSRRIGASGADRRIGVKGRHPESCASAELPLRVRPGGMDALRRCAHIRAPTWSQRGREGLSRWRRC